MCRADMTRSTARNARTARRRRYPTVRESVWPTPSFSNSGEPADGTAGLGASGVPRGVVRPRHAARMDHVPDAPRMSNRSSVIGRTLSAAAASDPGLHREVNEDRLLCDPSRGLFIVIDGVGGQAAGGRAADIALTTIRTRL